jgi:acyl-CoA-dependent ceramide synthase
MQHSESLGEIGDENCDVTQAWYLQDGNQNVGIDQKLNRMDSAELHTRSMAPRRKARRKDDGPLAIMCEWVVEHQIGERVWSLI